MCNYSLRKYLYKVLLILLFSCTNAFAAANVSLTPAGDSSYSVLGAGMTGVAGIQLDITYDAASLSSPTVTQGALVNGAMLAANTAQPGKIRIAIVSTNAFSGNGLIATISFAGKTGAGGLTSANVSMINTSGATVAATASITGAIVNNNNDTAGLPFSQPTPVQPTQNLPTTSSSTGTATTTPVYLGAVSLPPGMQQQVEAQASQSSPTPTPVPAATVEQPAKPVEQVLPASKPAVEVKPEETPQYVVYKGVSDRFKLYNGSRKLTEVTALFDKNVAQSITQSPKIVISDGTNKAILTVDIPSRISASPNFAVNGGSLVSYKQDKQQKGRWFVEILPEAGVTKVITTIIVSAEQFEYPLTVAPPIKTTLSLDEKGWNKFIKETGTAAAPLNDLNNDGVRNYLDEYILAANILAAKSASPKPAVKQKKSAK